jgi:EmrB/QacA subfamily drug resistance transporter
MPFSGENKKEKITVLLTMCFALFMAMLDNTIVNVALPTLEKKLHAGFSGLQWIVDGYVLAFASLLLTGGILGDRYGRKKMFLSGLAIFTASSFACGLSATTGQLVVFRALQGVGGALLIPGTLAILTVTFPPRERAQALGIWAGVSGLALAAGPTLGGYMVQHVSWQSVFFLNVPIGIIGFFVASAVVKESRQEQARALDTAGLVIGTAALFFMTYGLIEANQRGWRDPYIVGSLGAAALLLAAFLRYESRSPKAMLPLRFFKIPAFAAGNAVAFAISLGMFGCWFFMSLYMQNVRGYSPTGTGLRFLPMTVAIIITAPNAGKYASKHGSRAPMTLGLTLAGSGLLALSIIANQSTPLPVLLVIMMFMGSGMGMTMAPMTAAVMNAVGPERAGLGSAATNTSREVGGVFGIALLGTLLATKLKASLSGAIAGLGLPASVAHELVTKAGQGQIGKELLARIPPDKTGAVAHLVSNAFLSGFHLALAVGGSTLLVAAIVSSRWIPSGAAAHDVHEGALEPVATH